MNWLTDNLLFFLAAVVAALGVALLCTSWYFKAQIAKRDAAYEKLNTQYTRLETVNVTNVQNVEALTNKYNALVNKRRLELAAAASKAQELDKLKLATAAQLDENRKLRDQLAAKDIDVKNFLTTGIMPQPLACQLWPTAKECPK